MRRIPDTAITSLTFSSFLLGMAWSILPQFVMAEGWDWKAIEPDLSIPEIRDAPPGAGKRVRVTTDGWAGSEVFHLVYLPDNWKPDSKTRYPVIVEYPGNGPYRNQLGDSSSGLVEDCKLGFGMSGGTQFIWVSLPFISHDGKKNQRMWWGDREATVLYCKKTIKTIINDYQGDPERMILCGFSRGAIAANYIGLYDDEIADLWCGFFCHSHYDGIRQWGQPDDSGIPALKRLKRLGKRPQFISHEMSVEATRKYLEEHAPGGAFTFYPLPFKNHTDLWVLRDLPARQKLRSWLHGVIDQ